MDCWDFFMSVILILGAITITTMLIVMAVTLGNSEAAQPRYNKAIIWFAQEKVELGIEDYKLKDDRIEIQDEDGNIYLINNENIMLKGR